MLSGIFQSEKFNSFLINRDLADLASGLGERASSMLTDSERVSSANDSQLVQNLETSTDTYIKFQKVICGRDLSPNQAQSALFGGGSQSQ